MQLTLEIAIKQQTTISPQLQQAIRLLQLSSMEILNEIQQVAERNPLLELEEKDPKTFDEYAYASNNFTSAQSAQNHFSFGDNHDPFANTVSVDDLKSHLSSQIYLLKLSPIQKTMADTIIDSISNDGYFCSTIKELYQTLTIQQLDTSEKELADVLNIVQACEPAGVGARDIKECILLQLKRLNASLPEVNNAITIAEDYFDVYSKREFNKICKKTNWSLDELLAASSVIKSLNPRPGASFSQLINPYVIPDVIVRKINNQWCVYLNPTNNFTPRINKNYLALLNNATNKKDTQYFKENLKEAKWLITSIETRHQTLLKVTKAIMNHQADFLEHGETRMKPLKLATIAEQVELHESTISRVTTQKYIVTPFGIFELKHFFSSQIQSQSGQACSSTAIKAFIKKLIDGEDKQKPLSDNLIMKLLGEQDIKLARRTVTKYRETMSMLSSTERKRYF